MNGSDFVTKRLVAIAASCCRSSFCFGVSWSSLCAKKSTRASMFLAPSEQKSLRAILSSLRSHSVTNKSRSCRRQIHDTTMNINTTYKHACIEFITFGVQKINHNAPWYPFPIQWLPAVFKLLDWYAWITQTDRKPVSSNISPAGDKHKLLISFISTYKQHFCVCLNSTFMATGSHVHCKARTAVAIPVNLNVTANTPFSLGWGYLDAK